MAIEAKTGVFSWNELMTTDVAAAKSFYTQLLGWEAEDMPMQDGQNYTVLKLGEEQVGGLMELPQQAREMGAPPYWGSYITVDDVDAIIQKAQEMGATVLVPTMDIPGVGRFATIQDPQGAVISFIAYEPQG